MADQSTGVGVEPPILLAATWGLPWQWEEIRYVSETREDVQVDSRTSLSALLEELNPERILVVVQDTIVFSRKYRECALSSQGAAHPTNQGRLTYSSLLERARELIVEWIGECSSSDEQTRERLLGFLKNGKLRVEVVPGRGFFNEWEYGAYKPARENGQLNIMSSFYAESLHMLVDNLREIGARSLVVDLSHGINYTHSLFAHASHRALEIHAISSSKGESPPSYKLLMYNSEPIQHGMPRENKRSFVRMVSYREINPLEILGVAVQEAVTIARRGYKESNIRRPVEINKMILKPGHGLDIEGLSRSLDEAFFLGERVKLKRMLLHGRKIASALLYSMALPFFLLSIEIRQHLGGTPPLDLLVKGIEELRRLRNTWTIVDAREKKTYPLFAFDSRKLEELLLLAALATYAYNNYDHINIKEPHKNGTSVEDLFKIVQLMPPQYRVFAEVELNRLDKFYRDWIRSKELRQDQETSLEIPIGEGKWPGKPCIEGSMDTRNLMAHAGLERNIVEAKIEDRGLYIRYRFAENDGEEPKCWRTLSRKLLEIPSYA